MSVSIQEVIESARFNIYENIEDAKWLLAQKEEFYELCEKAEECVEDYEEYQDFVEMQEDEFNNFNNPSFEEWRKVKNEQ